MVQSKALRPEWLPAVALSAVLAAADARLEPAGRRPRRPGLPHRALPARRPGDLERQLVRRPLHAHLQLPLPAAGGAARPAGGRDALGRRLLLPLRPPRPRPLGGGGALGDALVRRRRRHPARRRPAHLRARRRLRPRRAALPCRSAAATLAVARRRGLRALQPGRRRLPRRRRRSPGRWSGAAGSTAPRSASAALALGLDRRPQPRLPRTGPVPLRLLLLRRDPALVRRRRSSSPAACAARSGSCAGCSSATCSPRPLVWLAPNALGGNAVRLGALFGGPVLAAVLLARRPRPSRASAFLALVDGRRPLLAGDRQRHPDRPQRRRPLDRRLLLPARRALAARPRRPAARGSRCRRPPTTGSRPTWRRSSSSPAAGCASSTPPATTSSTTKARSPTPPTAPGCAATRSPTSPCPTPRSTTPRSPSAA